jgi:hypothetical protein
MGSYGTCGVEFSGSDTAVFYIGTPAKSSLRLLQIKMKIDNRVQILLTVKVKLSPYLTKYHTMKIYGGLEV